MNIIDEANIICGGDIEVAKGIVIRQPTMQEILKFGESEYMSLVQNFTSEPFDMPYYLSKAEIDFAKITPFQLFILLTRELNPQISHILIKDLDLSEFTPVLKDGEELLINRDGLEINSMTRDRIADIIRKMHNLPKNIITSCENDFTHELLISQQKEIERNERRRKMFGEYSAYVALVSSLACEWHSFDKVLSLPVGQFFDAITRLGYKTNAQNLYKGIYSGSISYKNINKKDLDWMRPIKIRTL